MSGRFMSIARTPSLSRVLAGAAAAGILSMLLAGWSVSEPATSRGQVVVVKMVDVSTTEYRFEPADVTVHPGDTVRFEQTGSMSHNVEFREVPAESQLGDRQMGPYLTAPGETYDVVIDARFTDGVHKYVCTPHETLGMKGTITVGGGS